MDADKSNPQVGSWFKVSGVIVRLDQSVFTISGNLRMAKPVSSFTSEMAKDFKMFLDSNDGLFDRKML